MKKLFLFPLYFIPILLMAQKQMSLEDCMHYAVENSFKTARAVIESENAKKDYTSAILAHLPGVDGYIGINSNFGRGIDPATNNYGNTTTFSNGVGVNARVPIFNGLRYLNRTRSAKIAKLRGEEQLRQTRDKVAEETMLAYAEVVYYKELLRLYEKRIENYKLEEKKMERLLEMDGGSIADLAQIRAILASEEYTAIATRNNLDISILKLKDCMNYPIEIPLLIEPQIKEAELFLDGQTVSEIIAFASIIHPTVITEQHNVEIQKHNLSIERGSYYPLLSMSGGISTDFFTSSTNKYDPFFTQYKNNLGEYVGVHLSVPIFSGLDVRLRVSKAKNNLKQARQDYDETIRMLASEIMKAIMELDASKSQWQQAKKNVEFQQIANQANKRKYEVGALSIIELQTSDNQLFLSEIELNNSYLLYQIKIREINYYKGVPYVEISDE